MKLANYECWYYEHKRHDLGHQFFFPQKFDLINLFLKLGHSLLFNVFCA